MISQMPLLPKEAHFGSSLIVLQVGESVQEARQAPVLPGRVGNTSFALIGTGGTVLRAAQQHKIIKIMIIKIFICN